MFLLPFLYTFLAITFRILNLIGSRCFCMSLIVRLTLGCNHNLEQKLEIWFEGIDFPLYSTGMSSDNIAPFNGSLGRKVVVSGDSDDNCL